MGDRADRMAAFDAEAVSRVHCVNCGDIDVQSVFVLKRIGTEVYFNCPACDSLGRSEITHDKDRGCDPVTGWENNRDVHRVQETVPTGWLPGSETRGQVAGREDDVAVQPGHDDPDVRPPQGQADAGLKQSAAFTSEEACEGAATEEE